MIERFRLRMFLQESLAIEGIMRGPTDEEMAATEEFLDAKPAWVLGGALYKLQAVYAPGMPIRNRKGMNVKVGNYMPPPGCPQIEVQLARLLDFARRGRYDPWHVHVAFEAIHPFMDGNGRTGRALWARMMMNVGDDPFRPLFLHRFYYQTLANTATDVLREMGL